MRWSSANPDIRLMANQLANERSPYLRQHRDNPVHWLPWGPDALKKAAAENKLVIVSIGYSSCHWCHVMERESFENHDVAAVMNADFVSIKIDREERPDIDQIYMLAVQLMTGNGGWPLNCICLPDGRPIYGGTYFRPDDWMNVLRQLQQVWKENPDTAYEYAERLAEGIQQSEQLPVERLPAQYDSAQLHAVVNPWKEQFDSVDGGLDRAPKFPMPINWDFLLQYAVLEKDQAVADHVHFTLKKIASGGIYDHVGGGFARYSVDGRWHVPHFEKMLYDNAQLVSLYLSAWQHRPDPQYLRTVRETLAWVSREMTDPNGGFYCALDADSEGVEGKFYTFTLAEMEDALKGHFEQEDIDLVVAHFNVTAYGNWAEERVNVLFHDHDADELAASQGFSMEEWDAYLSKIKSRLLAYRAERVRPGLDDKQLAAWNALMLKAFTDSYRILGNQTYLEVALRNAAFIQKHLYHPNGGLLHQPADDNRSIAGFLDDYAFCVEAFIGLYEATFDETWLREAKRLADFAIAHFWDDEAEIFYYTDDSTETLITRQAELMDDVIPSSNATLIRQLRKLGLIFDEPHYQELVDRVLPRIIPQMEAYGKAYSSWGILLAHEIHGTNEVILSGLDAGAMRATIDRQYIPNKMVLGGTASDLPILHGRLSEEDQAYLCRNRTCSLPVKTAQELLAMLAANN